MRNIKLTIEYNGTHFAGWQYQPKERTVQGEIQKALKIIFKKDIPINGSGRTDAGVHAVGQVANFKLESPMKAEEIVRALNGNLSDDVSIISATDVKKTFHSRYSAKKKTYCYSICNRASRPSLTKDYVLHFPYKINLAAMKREASSLIGRHDFRSFTASDPSQQRAMKDKNTIRTIYDLRISKKSDIITIAITANGFLYKMVRNIVGTLLDVGSGKVPAGAVKSILKAKSRIAARATAPAKGLMLLRVNY